MAERRGSIAFFTTYRPPVPLDIYSSPIDPDTDDDELLMTDGKSYNYNGREIPPAALKTILRCTILGKRASVKDVDSGYVSGMIFVSERTHNLETLHIALRFHRDYDDENDDDDDDDDEDDDDVDDDDEDDDDGDDDNDYDDDVDDDYEDDEEDEDDDEDEDDEDDDESAEVYNFAQLYKTLNGVGMEERVEVYNFGQLYKTFNGVRMEDSGCFVDGRYFIYVSTKEPNYNSRQPWTAVYRTDLENGKTIRLTPPGVADFSPSASPSGRKIAIATLQFKEGGWTGEIENLKTDIVVIDVIRKPFKRQRIIEDGGWPTWGSKHILYFHRAKQIRGRDGKTYNNWGVFRADIRNGFTRHAFRMTPDHVDAMTPAAIDEYRVVVAVIREKLDLGWVRKSSRNYRHIEVFDKRAGNSFPVSRRIQRKADHYNPFVIKNDNDGPVLIGYNSCSEEQLERGDISEDFDKIKSKDSNEVGVFRVPGVFPTFTQDGRKLAFVDNDFKNVYLADDRGGLRIIFSVTDPNLELDEDEMNVFSPVWNQNREKDILYVCVGPPFKANKQVDIYAIFNASSLSNNQYWQRLTTTTDSNNAFPSTNPDGTKLVYRSTRDWVGEEHNSPTRPKNLYIMEDVLKGETRRASSITRITKGNWIDTHCQWSQNGRWIVFSSTRDKPQNAPRQDNGLDPGYYAVYLMKAKNPYVVVRVISSDNLRGGHVNHPMFSPDGKSIVFSSDHAGVSVEPISLPLFLHSVRPYGDIFTIDIDPHDIYANIDLTKFNRVTHSRYENSTPNWSKFSTEKLRGAWRGLFKQCHKATWRCPFEASRSETW